MWFLRLMIALGVCSGFVHANTIILQSVDAPLGMQQTLWINEDGVATQLFWAGGINGTIDGHARVRWCVELFVNIGLNTTYNTVLDWADTPNLKRAAWMMQNQVQGVTTQIQGAAFQLAIWDVIEDGGDGFNAGRVAKSTSATHPTDAAVLAQATSYEGASLGKVYLYEPVYHNATLSGTHVQNLMSPIFNDGGPESFAPEPKDVSMVLGGLVLILLGRYRKAAVQARAESRRRR